MKDILPPRRFLAVMHEGKPVVQAKVAFARHLSLFGDGEEVEIVVQRRVKRRSAQANRYWWGVVIRVAAESLGYSDPDELHEAIVHKFRPLEPDALTGAPRRMRTSKMTSEQFSDFTSEVIQWLETDMGIRVPRPHEIDEAA